MKTITLILEHEFGDIVYLKSDDQKLPRVVVGLEIDPSLTIRYLIQTGSWTSTAHYAFEIVKEKHEIKIF